MDNKNNNSKMLTKEELKILLRLVCEDADKSANYGKTPTKEMYDLRYKLRDMLESPNSKKNES